MVRLRRSKKSTKQVAQTQEPTRAEIQAKNFDSARASAAANHEVDVQNRSVGVVDEPVASDTKE